MKGGAISAINRVVLHSGLTRDPDLRHTPDGAPVVTLRLGFTAVEVVEGERRELPEGTSWRPAGSRAGRIPHVKLGRYYRYRRRSIERWMHAIESDRIVSGAGNGQRVRASSARRRRE